MSSKDEPFDWESHEYSCRSTHGRTQEKTVFRPRSLGSIEYVLWNDGFKGPALNMPRDSFVFREHGIEPHVKARLSIAGSLDFICGAGELKLTIDIDQADAEEQYLKELVRMLELARKVIKDRQAYLKQKKVKTDEE